MAKIKTRMTSLGREFLVAGKSFKSYTDAKNYQCTLGPKAFQAPKPKLFRQPGPSYLMGQVWSNINKFYAQAKNYPFWANVYSNPSFEDNVHQVHSMAAPDRTTFVVIIDKDNYQELMLDYSVMCYLCPVCHKPAITQEWIQKAAYGDVSNLCEEFEDGVFCHTCKLSLGLIFTNVATGKITAKFFPGKPMEFWYEWQGQYYQREEGTYACPVCDHKFTLTEQVCTQCAAQLGDYKKIFKPLYEVDAWRYDMARTDYKGRWYATVTLTWNPTISAYNLKFNDFVTKELIDILKLAIPGSDRSYDPKTKTWTFTEPHYDFIHHLMEQKYQKVITYTKEKIEEQYKQFTNAVAPINTESLLGTFVKLVNEAGITIPNDIKDGKAARKAYLRAAMFYHPDRNPDRAGDMSKLNEAWTNLQEYFGLRGTTA